MQFFLPFCRLNAVIHIYFLFIDFDGNIASKLIAKYKISEKTFYALKSRCFIRNARAIFLSLKNLTIPKG